MRAAAFKRHLADFRSWAHAVPCTPKNSAPRVASELAGDLTRDQAEQIVEAWGEAIVTYKYGPPKKKRAAKKTKAPK